MKYWLVTVRNTRTGWLLEYPQAATSTKKAVSEICDDGSHREFIRVEEISKEEFFERINW
jgi:hypothetical protein